jgi:hypothetical protein
MQPSAVLQPIGQYLLAPVGARLPGRDMMNLQRLHIQLALLVGHPHTGTAQHFQSNRARDAITLNSLSVCQLNALA